MSDASDTTGSAGGGGPTGTAPTATQPQPLGGGGPVKEQEEWYIRWWKQIRSLALLILVMFAARSVIFDWNDVPSGSMQPTILVGDRVFVNRLAYGLKVPFTTIHLLRWGAPVRGDIVVFYAPDKDGTRMIKRVIGVPGDVVTLVDNQLTINGKPASYEPVVPGTMKELPMVDQTERDFFEETIDGLRHWVAKDPGMSVRGGDGRRNIREIVVPPGKFMMIGDNRDFSMDSRFWGRDSSREPVAGLVDQSQVLGRAWRVAFSLDKNRYYAPRWDRFFGALYDLPPAK